MKYRKEIFLKDNSVCLLRNPTAEDAQGILNIMRLTSSETENMRRYPDEIRMTADEEANFLQSIEESEESLMICAEIDGKIVGNGGISPVASVEKCRHRANLGIAVQKAYNGLGIGTQIVSALLEEAKKAGYEQVELDVVTDNYRAIGIYERLGFVRNGEIPNAFKRRDGGYQNLYCMHVKL